MKINQNSPLSSPMMSQLEPATTGQSAPASVSSSSQVVSQQNTFESGEQAAVNLLGSGPIGNIEVGEAGSAPQAGEVQPLHSALGQEFRYGIEATLGAYGIGDIPREGDTTRYPEMTTPPNVEGMEALELPQLYAFMASDGTQLNYPERTVFMDRENGEFFLKAQGTVLTQAGSMPSTEHWYGPLAMPAGVTEMTFSGAAERAAQDHNLSQGAVASLDTPPNVDGLHAVSIPSRSYGGFIVDGQQLYNAKETAHVDAEANQFFLEVKGDYMFEDAGFVPAADSAWFGPFPLFDGEPTSTLSVGGQEARVFESFDRMTSTVLVEGHDPFPIIKKQNNGHTYFETPTIYGARGQSLEEVINAVLS